MVRTTNFSRTGLLLAALAIVVAGGLWFPQTGSAHLELVETTPPDGASLTSPVERIVLRFTVPGEPAGPGIRILNGQGEAVSATVRRSGDGTVFLATPASPLEDGRFGVAWRVAAPDAHPVSGGFSFTVSPATAGAPGGAEAPAPGGDDPLAAALRSPDDRGAKLLAGVGRALAYGGGLFAIGGLAFLAFAMVGVRPEIMRLFAALRAAGLLAFAGAVVGVVARAWLIDGGGPEAVASTASLGDALGGEAGLALVVTAAGGLLVALGARSAYRPAPGVAIAAGSWDAYRPQRVVGGSIGNAWLAVAGVVAIAIGAALDGHTASEGPRAVVWAADLLHVGAAGIWFGGLALLVALLVGRRRAGHPSNVAYPAVRFSTLAGAGSAVAGLAGIVLAIIILPSLSALWDTTWGLLLIAKVVLVALVGAMGAHNHLRLIPKLTDMLDAAGRSAEGAAPDPHRSAPRARGDRARSMPLEPQSGGPVATLVHQEAPAVASVGSDEDAIARALRRNAAIELGLLAVVIALTAALVGTSAV